MAGRNRRPGPDADAQPGTPARLIALATLRTAATTAALLALYYLLPLDRHATWASITALAVGLAALIALIIFQVRSILSSPFPELRAVEALATSIPLFLLLFARTYFVLEGLSSGNFTQALTRSDSLYFTVTVFSTVGFGDITPKTELARLLVTGQMIADVIILGLAVKVIVGAVRSKRSRKAR